MKPFIILVVAFFVVLGFGKLTGKELNLFLIARLALSCMLVFIALGHFIYGEELAEMIPLKFSNKGNIITILALTQLLASITLHIPLLRKSTGWLLIVYFLFIFSITIYAAFQGNNYQTIEFKGQTTLFIWLRLPFQILLVLWTYWSAIKWKD